MQKVQQLLTKTKPQHWPDWYIPITPVQTVQKHTVQACMQQRQSDDLFI